METAAMSEPQPSMQNAFSNLAEAYSQHLAGETFDRRQVAQNLINLYRGLEKKDRKNPKVAIFFRQFKSLIRDTDTGQSLIEDPDILKLIYQRQKPKYSVKTKLALGAAALGAVAIGTGSMLMAEGPDLVITPPTATAAPELEIPTPTTTQTATNTATSTSTAIATHTATATATPTVNPAEVAKKEFGDINMAEYFLGDLIKILKDRRLEKAATDPAYAERINKEFLNSNSINILYLGIDNTRERPDDFNTRDWGRADITMLVTFDPKTFKINAISFPRDMFVPELTSFRFQGGARINAATMTPYVDSKVDSFKLASKIIESATGMPIDFAFKTNIDFMQGYPGYPSFFDTIFPNGLPIRVPYEIRDNEYPTANYGSKKLVIIKGDHIMNGRQLTEFGRSRHETSDFDRSERQRLILYSAFRQLFPEMLKDFVGGKTDTIDRVISALEKQQKYANLSSDLNILEVAKTIKSGVERLRQDPKGIATLALLAANSPKDYAFNSLGLTRANGLVANVGEDEFFYWPYMLKVEGSDTSSKPTKLGNFLNYWKTIRQKILTSVLR